MLRVEFGARLSTREQSLDQKAAQRADRRDVPPDLPEYGTGRWLICEAADWLPEYQALLTDALNTGRALGGQLLDFGCRSGRRLFVDLVDGQSLTSVAVREC
ncbi:hypothetical protein AWC12_16190 [Mycolicibacterium iranicum]|uniref:Uncharacterized protein n=1 Tax=Mycolicibacterium iranicum TaxID=912594 RepID=A0A1X1WMN0_MYCIR|nr:hypothetical protein AWC12_16190 [Mycolicibacterium iranicum]